MLHKLKNRKEEGFTIIEVLIVLAIAGLIILIVLLAVPALQRNSRNTSMKNDAGAVAGGVSEFESNNDGAAPNAANSVCATGSVSFKSSATSPESKPKVQGNTKVNCTLTGAQATVTPAAGEVNVIFGSVCGSASADGKSYSTTTNTRGVAIIYANETSSQLQAKCTDS